MFLDNVIFHFYKSLLTNVNKKMFFFNEGFPYWCAFAHKKQVNMVIGQNTCNSVISHHRDHQWLKVNCKSHSFRGMRTNKKSYPS